jgi:hypothetical protein
MTPMQCSDGLPKERLFTTSGDCVSNESEHSGCNGNDTSIRTMCIGHWSLTGKLSVPSSHERFLCKYEDAPDTPDHFS